MKTIKAKIEGNRKTGFNVYLPDSQLPFGLFGEGNTEKDAIEGRIFIKQVTKRLLAPKGRGV